MVKKEIIWFDIDDVIWNFTQQFLNFYNKEHNTNFSLNEVNKWDIGSLLQNINNKNIYDYIFKYEIFSNMIPYSDTKKLIEELKEHYHIKLITSRPNTNDVIKITEDWLKKHSIFYHSLHIEAYKSYLCRDLNISYFIDDNLENIIKISKNSKTKWFLLKKHWNWEEEINRLLESWVFTKEQIEKALKNIHIVENVEEIKTHLNNKKV